MLGVAEVGGEITPGTYITVVGTWPVSTRAFSLWRFPSKTRVARAKQSDSGNLPLWAGPGDVSLSS